MTDYSEQGAVPVEDNVSEDPPTVDDVLEEQRRRHPHQAETSSLQPGAHHDDESERPADDG